MGYTEELFWDLTPNQYNLHMQAASEKEKRARRYSVEDAYLNAMLPHMGKKTPSLDKILQDYGLIRKKSKDEDFLEQLMKFDASLPKQQPQS